MTKYMNSKRLLNLKERFQESIIRIVDLHTLNKLKIDFLGNNGEITSLLKEAKDLIGSEQHKDFYKMIYEIKDFIIKSISSKYEELRSKQLETKFASDKIDITLPGHDIYVNFGKKHILTHSIEQIRSIMAILGFEEQDGPEIESEWYNFTALNIGVNHPARQMCDTFYVNLDSSDQSCHDQHNKKMLLRTHTSTVQIRYMENHQPPIKMFNCGRVYRADHDATHTPMFHQLEIVWIDNDITIAHMIDIIESFFKLFFNTDKIIIRFRSSYFPFTIPSFEFDMRFDTQSTRVGGCVEIDNKENWLEIGGCGMVHPNVLENVKISSNKYQGFAVGVGIDRITMLKYNIDDLRHLFENDKRWIDHYGITFCR